MRRVYHAHLSLACRGSHPRSAELGEMNRLVDANHLALKAVQADLLSISNADAKRGRKGMSAEQVVRVAVVKQMLGVSYDELAFRLSDSAAPGLLSTVSRRGRASEVDATSEHRRDSR